MKLISTLPTLLFAVSAAMLGHAPAMADAVTDWNLKANEFTLEARLGTPPAMRVMAIVQTAVYQALQGLPAGAHDAAVAAANRTTLRALLPTQASGIEAAYKAAIDTLPDSPLRQQGLVAGERAAVELLQARAHESAVLAAPDATRPHVGGPGSYVPTALPAATAWPRRTPWHLNSPSQFRPGPPPALTSDTWARDFEEVKTFGGRASTARSTEQSEIARFWDFSMPAIYHGVLRSVAAQPGRDTLVNARLLATASQALDDALISVFDAKYHHNFWRPVTAIRNADIDGHPATTRDAAWISFIDVPMHPEYPSGHSILAGALGAVLKAEIGSAPVPRLWTTSATSATKGAVRHWTRIEDLVDEIAMARVWGGLHYRTTNEVSIAMGRAIGELAARRVGNDLH